MPLFENPIGIILGAAFVIVSVVIIWFIKRTVPPRSQTGEVGENRFIELNPQKIVTEIYDLSPFEQDEAKQKYLGLKVECPTYLSQVEKNLQRKDILQVVLRYKHDRRIAINCEVKSVDYKDLFWMEKGTEVRVVGELFNIGQSFVDFKNVRLQFPNLV